MLPTTAQNEPRPIVRAAPIQQAAVVAARERQAQPYQASTVELPPPLRLRMVRDSWVEVYDATGRRLEHNLLRAGEQHDLHGEPPFSLLVAQGPVLELWLHGQPVAFAADSADGLIRFSVGEAKQP